MIYTDKLLKVNSRCRGKERYLSLGYNDRNGYFYVKSEDLPEHSGILEVRKCDCCGKDFERRHEHHVVTNNRFGKDICGECVASEENLRKEIQKKKEETWENKYGCHPMQVEEIKDKVFAEWEEKYGGHPMHNKEVKEKWKNTIIERYGGMSPLCDNAVREKSMQTLSKNDKVPTSSQQLEIFNVLCDKYGNDKCELNKPLSNLALDIVIDFYKIKIDIEYDGRYWHQDEQKDRRRDEFVKSQGYKILRIKAKHKIPDITQLSEKIDFLINTEHNYTCIELE